MNLSLKQVYYILTNLAEAVIKEPKFVTYLYNNKVQLFRNGNIIGDSYISHRNITDYHKISILKSIAQDYRQYYKQYFEENKKSLTEQKPEFEKEDSDQPIKEVKEDLVLDYSSKSLLDIVKQKFNICQQFVESHILESERYYHQKRKQDYKIIPIQVDPPKPEEEDESLKNIASQ